MDESGEGSTSWSLCVYPVVVEDEQMLEKAEQYCRLSNSLNSEVTVERI